MLWNLSLLWMLIAGGTVFGISYMLALMMESSIARQGYGPLVNAFVISGGFFGAIYYANLKGIRLGDLEMALTWGGAGAAGLFLSMIVVRAIALRFS